MSTRFLAAVFFLVWCANSSGAADRVADQSSGKTPASGDLVFFPMDDESIPWRDNLKLSLQQPKKYAGNPVMKAGPLEGVDGYGTLLYGTVIKQGSKLRMWYLATPRADSRVPGEVQKLTYFRPVAYAESTDGIHWERPDLGLVEFRGNKHNNLVRIEPAREPYATAYDFIAVFHEPGDPVPTRRFKMAYITHDPARGSGTTATAVSPDGLNWKLLNTTPIVKGHFENTSLTKFEDLYYMAGQNIPPFDASLGDGSGAGRVMKIFFSPDFEHWSSGRALGFYRSTYETQPTSRGQEVHMGAGLWNRGNVLLGFYGRWHGDTVKRQPQASLAGLKIDLGLVVSNDAIHYREPVRDFVVVPRGPDDAWDSEGILQANAFANTETETLIWYSHWNTTRPDVTPPLPEKLSPLMIQKGEGIGLLTMPRDRFGYLTKLLPASQERVSRFNAPIEGSCLTRSIRLPRGGKLFANVDEVSSGAMLRIDLVDDGEHPLAGYSAQLSASSLKAEVLWHGKKLLPAGRPFRIKVTWPVQVDTPKLYALYIEQ